MQRDLNSIIETLKPITEYDLEGRRAHLPPDRRPFATSCAKTWSQLRSFPQRGRVRRTATRCSRTAASRFPPSWARGAIADARTTPKRASRSGRSATASVRQAVLRTRARRCVAFAEHRRRQDKDIHAFLELTPEALALRPRPTGSTLPSRQERVPHAGNAGRRAHRLQGQHEPYRHAHDLREPHARDLREPLRRRRASRRRDATPAAFRIGKTQHGRVRVRLLDRDLVRSVKTMNPWDLERVPGGSSGGCCRLRWRRALRAVSLGSDTGGSDPPAGQLLRRGRHEAHVRRRRAATASSPSAPRSIKVGPFATTALPMQP